MPLVTNSNGVQTYVSDDVARAMAADLIERIESATRRSDLAGGPLSASTARQVHADFEEAERLLRDTGDLKGRSIRTDSLSRFYQPGESERILAERAQLKHEAQTVTRAGALLGVAWADRAKAELYNLNNPPPPGDFPEPVAESPEQQDDVVRLKRDKVASEWVLSGKGPVTRFKNYDLAEAAARRRAGWT